MQSFEPGIENVAVLVASYDASSDLWDPLFTLFRRFWPDCPFRVYLVSNALQYKRWGVTTIAVGPDRSWSDTLRAGLERVREDYVLLWIDDHFLVGKANHIAIMESIGDLLRRDGNYLRLNPLPRPDHPVNDYFGEVRKGAIYRTATGASVWKKSVLRELLRSGESAWEFETAGSARSDRFDRFFSSWKRHFAIENLMIKGKARPRSLRRIEQCLGYSLQLNRPSLTVNEELAFFLRVCANRTLVWLPSRFARTTRSILLRQGPRGQNLAAAAEPQK